MDLKELGTTRVRVPAIGIGTWAIGGGLSKNTSGDNEAIRAIRRAIKLGMYLVDTAEMYDSLLRIKKEADIIIPIHDPKYMHIKRIP
jgi:aryl-alcohol dehydrogenase-like predicted oxidoreductase